ncbi:tRNA threonylcarbamoyladenosine dehydratase [Fluviicola sp.]|uniref:tRNA threonylcarbamoyladenosine dehydratase n=1 Tax=Fluviicola sp. TaxID=1917219 RepID=UPI0031CF9129
MSKWLERTELILGPDEMNRLKSAHVLIVGLGGIGSFAGEFIARAGVGTMTIIDGDAFDITNKNRQLTALDSTIGKNKALVLAERIRDINPEIQLNVIEEFVLPARVWEILDEYRPDYVMDCIDSVTPKLEWIVACKSKKIKVITHLGAGGKTDPTRVHVAKLPDSHNCKLGAHVKKRLKKKGVRFEKIKCVYSSELQQKESLKMTDGSNFKRSFYGTVSYMPALFGLMGASEVIRYLTQKEPSHKR